MGKWRQRSLAFMEGAVSVFDIDASCARTRMRKILHHVIDAETGLVRRQETSIGHCFKMTGDLLRTAIAQYEGSHPESRRHFG
jgi:hypothetical protein